MAKQRIQEKEEKKRKKRKKFLEIGTFSRIVRSFFLFQFSLNSAITSLLLLLLLPDTRI